MFRRRHKKPPPGEFPPSFTRAFFRQTMPTTSPAEARRVLEHVRGKGWSEEEIAEVILPYMPPARPSAGGREPRSADVPDRVSPAWLDEHLPEMDREGIRRVVDELERRGWPPADAAVAVLPHLLPKLPPEDVEAILAGLREIGVSDEQIARLADRSGRG
ncbi:MAG: hypothetical protein M3131_07045 [Actinomycetota bacterium]|nr:hypothetical protein [Actinomycetota bacterium]